MLQHVRSSLFSIAKQCLIESIYNIYAFISCWTIVLLSFLTIIKMLLWKLVYKFLRGSMFLYIQKKYGVSCYQCSFWEDARLFSMWTGHFMFSYCLYSKLGFIYSSLGKVKLQSFTLCYVQRQLQANTKPVRWTHTTKNNIQFSICLLLYWVHLGPCISRQVLYHRNIYPFPF